MAKADLLKEAQAAGLVSEDATENDFTVVQLEALLGRAPAAGVGYEMAKEPIVQPDGHVSLSQEDIDNRA